MTYYSMQYVYYAQCEHFLYAQNTWICQIVQYTKIAQAAKMQSTQLDIHFPVTGMNQNSIVHLLLDSFDWAVKKSVISHRTGLKR